MEVHTPESDVKKIYIKNVEARTLNFDLLQRMNVLLDGVFGWCLLDGGGPCRKPKLNEMDSFANEDRGPMLAFHINKQANLFVLLQRPCRRHWLHLSGGIRQHNIFFNVFFSLKP